MTFPYCKNDFDTENRAPLSSRIKETKTAAIGEERLRVEYSAINAFFSFELDPSNRKGLYQLFCQKNTFEEFVLKILLGAGGPRVGGGGNNGELNKPMMCVTAFQLRRFSTSHDVVF